jgi:hypothetical protein
MPMTFKGCSKLAAVRLRWACHAKQHETGDNITERDTARNVTYD